MVICYFVLHRIRLSRLTGYDVPGWQEWYADTAGNSRSRSSTPFPGVWNMRLSSGRQHEKTADHHAWSGIVCSARVCLKHAFREMYPEGHDRYPLKDMIDIPWNIWNSKNPAIPARKAVCALQVKRPVKHEPPPVSGGGHRVYLIFTLFLALYFV